MSKLVLHLGTLPVLELALPEGTTRLGRAHDNDIVLPLPEIADYHAEVAYTIDRVLVRALAGESLLVKGRWTTEAILAPGERMLIGGYTLQWLDGAPPGGPQIDHIEMNSHETHPTSPIEPESGAPAEPGAAIKCLVVLAGRDAGLQVAFDQPALLMGRAPDCDLILHDDTVSWRHMSLERVGSSVRVRDLGSRNGTYLDGRRIESALALCGARVRAGRTTLQLVARRPTSGTETQSDERDVDPRGFAEMIGRGAAMQRVYALVRDAAASKIPLLLLGETGTGKELAARAIHARGPRASGPFFPINCAAIPHEMIEDELFGHTRGAFTGAVSDRRGAFESAEGGTIFLDEIAEMPLDLQPKLLRVLDDGYIPRIGGGGAKKEFRVISATNRDLSGETAAGRFRRDLYFRIAAFPIQLPPLSDRIDDLPDLVHNFLSMAEQQTGIVGTCETRFDEGAFVPLREYAWPGNVRELRNLILRAAVRRPGGVVDRELVEELLSESSLLDPVLPEALHSLKEIERLAIRNALRDCHGNRRATARRLGIAESTLYERIRRYGFDDEPFGSPR